MRAKDINRGEFRQLAAQIAMLYLTRQESGHLCDTKRDAIDTFYHKHLDFDAHSPSAKRLNTIFDLLTSLLGDGKRKQVIGHEAIGLVLLVDSLLDDYTAPWRTKFVHPSESSLLVPSDAAEARFDEKPRAVWVRDG